MTCRLAKIETAYYLIAGLIDLSLSNKD